MNEIHQPNCDSPDCASVEPLLSAYALEETTPAENSTIAAHVEACAKCREELELLRSTASLIARGVPPLTPLGPRQRAGVLKAASAAGRSSGNRKQRASLYWVGGLAAATLLTLGLWFLRESARNGTEIAFEAPRPDVTRKPGELDRVAEESLDRGVAAKPAETTALLTANAPVPPPPADKLVELAMLPPEAAAGPPAKPADELKTYFKRDASADEKLPTPLGALRVEATRTGLGVSGGSTHEYEERGNRDALTRDAAMPQTREPQPTALSGADPDRAFRGLAARRKTAGLEERRQLLVGEMLAKAPGVLRDEVDLLPESQMRDEKANKPASRGASLARRPEGEAKEQAPGSLEKAKEVAQDFSTVTESSRESLASQPAARAPGSAPTPLSGEDRYRAPAAKDPRGINKTPPADPASVLEGLQPQMSQELKKAEGGAGFALGFGESKLKSSLSDVPEPDKNGTAVQPGFEWRENVDTILSRLDRKPGETPDMMLFRYWGDNPFVEASSDALSTFGADVDTASYSLFRSYLFKQGLLPPKEAIRTEEFVNYFKGKYAPPTEEGRAFAVHTECAPSPFAHESEYKLLRIGIKGREVTREKRKAAALVFVIDTSGSMRRENRLELVKDALKLLVKELDEGDTIGIVAFDREARTILEPTPASEKERVIDAISRLEPRQNTNVSAGLTLGFGMAAAKLLKDGANRVILLSDGVANTGNTNVAAMLDQVRAERERGIYLTTVGVGMGNLNDALLEELADKGNGQCVYVDRVEEARKAFVDNLTGTLETIAKDVKIQVEFDSKKVLRYRLLGYENRAIADADFRDNKVDAGEIGAGHEVTAIYELKLRPESSGKLATVRVRNLTVDHGEAQEVAVDVETATLKSTFAEASPRFRLHACAAELAEVLRESYWARGSTLDRVAALIKDIMDLREREGGPRIGEDPDVVELLALVQRADALVRRRQAEADDVARTVDAIKDNIYLSARVEDELQRRNDQNRSQLDEIRRRNEELRHQLENLIAK